ncbi:MAG TPA: histidine kinase, partial [Pyrinomonadaceae bacterium]|nr:histidine kinase [Pyrinomonadaceae bacterium]
SNPRFGIDQTLHSVIKKLRRFYDADTCILIFSNDNLGHTPYRLHRVDRDENKKATPLEITEETATTLLLPSPTQAAIYRKRAGNKAMFYDVETRRLIEGAAESSALFNAFAGKACLTVPVWDHSKLRGRLFVVGGKRNFDQTEIEFILQLVEQVMPLLENIRLVDRLASDAAEHERRKIGQDIHDGVIQPYIGLQFGLAAVTHKLQNGDGDVRNEISDLLKLTEGEIKELRRYVGELRRGESTQGAFLPSVRQFAAKFSEATGLQIEIDSDDDLPIYDRLAAELFRMIEEGLSNIRRHSNSNYAKVSISRHKDDLVLQLRNRRRKNVGVNSFIPKSITERAAALGGRTDVYTNENNETVVNVQIPL